MPIEVPSVDWDEWASPFMPVARIHIPRQAFDWSARTIRREPVVHPVALPAGAPADWRREPDSQDRLRTDLYASPHGERRPAPRAGKLRRLFRLKAARRALTSANPAPALDGNTVSVDRNGVIQSFADITTADTALRLAQLFKTTPQFWMHMQANCDLKAAMARCALRGSRARS